MTEYYGKIIPKKKISAFKNDHLKQLFQLIQIISIYFKYYSKFQILNFEILPDIFNFI